MGQDKIEWNCKYAHLFSDGPILWKMWNEELAKGQVEKANIKLFLFLEVFSNTFSDKLVFWGEADKDGERRREREKEGEK